MTTLSAERISKAFGAVRAVDDVSVSIRPGEIHGLIGPNGSGKTTLLNLMTGYYRPDGGEIRLDAASLSGQPIQARARLAVGRTFQRPRILNSLSVVQNAMLGGWRDTRASFLEAAFGLPRARRERAILRERATEILHATGLGYALDWRAGTLTHAERRFLEIARTLVLRPRFVLLDEPAGGLTGAEIGQLGVILRTAADSGIGLLLVEHHTEFVFGVSQNVTVLNFGRVIKQGRPADVQRDPEVIRVYLGA